MKKMELYKYFKSEVGLAVLETGLIRFSPAKAFNDPFEMKPNIVGFAPSDELDDSVKRNIPDLIKEEYQKLPAYIRSSTSFEQYWELATVRIPSIHEGVKTSTQYLSPIIRAAFEDRIEKIIGVLCLTDCDSNLTMWAHYADSHKGLVIGFDTSHAFFSSTDTGSGQPCHLKEVTYCGERPKLTFSGLRAEDILLTKGKDWSRENEWRMFAGLSAGKEVTKEGEKIHLFTYPRESVTKIVVGCRTSSEVCEKVNRIKAATPDLARAVVLKASPDRNKYGLNFEAIVPD